MVDTGTRKARAISSVVRLASKRSVSATRASGERTGWQEMNMRRRRSSPTSSSVAVSRSATAISCWTSSSRPSSSCLRSSRSLRRRRSIPRCFAVVMSQAPGLSGTPDSGHCSSAATRASCARSSARPTSRTIRVSPAMSLGDSIRHTASIALCPPSLPTVAPEHFLDHGLTVSDDLPEALGPLESLVLRLHLDQCETAGQLLRLGEGSIRDGDLPCRAANVRALVSEPARREQDARARRFLDELPHLGHELRARRSAGLGVAGLVKQESHLSISFWSSFLPGLPAFRPAGPRLYRDVEKGNGEIDISPARPQIGPSGPASAKSERLVWSPMAPRPGSS